MQIQVRANHSVQTPASLEDWARRELGQALARFGDDLSSLEVHLEDTNAGRSSADHKRCTLEARLNGLEPVAVHHAAERLDDALRGACDKLLRSLDRTLARQRDATHRQRQSIRRGQEDED
jgi:hypothetical protein